MLAWAEILIRLFLASLFGALIGLERERKDWAAGLRTHMMVCVGSSLIMIVSAYGFSDVLGGKNITLDPSRIAAQVISGIGFIGAGTIIFLRQGTIRGLTTASGLWTVAAIGLATGGGMYFAAAATTFLAIIILWALQPLERMVSRRFKQKSLRIVMDTTVNSTDVLKKIWDTKDINLSAFSMDKGLQEFILLLKFDDTDIIKLTDLIGELHKEPGVKEIFWNK